MLLQTAKTYLTTREYKGTLDTGEGTASNPVDLGILSACGCNTEDINIYIMNVVGIVDFILHDAGQSTTTPLGTINVAALIASGKTLFHYAMDESILTAGTYPRIRLHAVLYSSIGAPADGTPFTISYDVWGIGSCGTLAQSYNDLFSIFSQLNSHGADVSSLAAQGVNILTTM